jgi:hypothetical protein
MGLNKEVQEYVRQAYVKPAEQRGETTVRIKAGDVHRSLHWSNRVPSVCTTLGSQKFQRETGLKLISKEGPPSGYGTRAVFTYEFEAGNAGSPKPAPKKPSLEALYGILAEALREAGGGEKYLRNERRQFDFRKEAGSQKDDA